MGRLSDILRKGTGASGPPVAVCFLGLGNPGEEYANTRHNIGWMLLDAWAKARGLDPVYRKQGPALCSAADTAHGAVLLVKPNTFMNRSGQAATYIRRHFAPQRLLVLADDMDLPLGRFKLTNTGGAGTHNGLRSVVAELNSKDFDRLKIGIGPSGETRGREFVLDRFSEDEKPEIDELLTGGVHWLNLYLARGLEVATQELQRVQRGRRLPPERRLE